MDILPHPASDENIPPFVRERWHTLQAELLSIYPGDEMSLEEYNEVAERVRALMAGEGCAHDGERRLVVVSNNYAYQCLRCWFYGGGKWLSKANLPSEEVAAAEPPQRFDPYGRRGLFQEIMGPFAARRKVTYENEQLTRRAVYEAHIASPEWKVIRKAKLQQARYVCGACGKVCADRAHHMTYDRLGCEDLRDLVALCHECHSRIHGRNC